MDETRSGAQRLGFMVPLILFILFFIICCGVLSSVFARSADLSAKAQLLNTSVQLCRNGAEVYTSCENLAQTKKAMGGTYFDSNGNPSPQKDAALYITMRETPGESGVRYIILEAFAVDGERLYTLTAGSYVCELGGH